MGGLGGEECYRKAGGGGGGEEGRKERKAGVEVGGRTPLWDHLAIKQSVCILLLCFPATTDLYQFHEVLVIYIGLECPGVLIYSSLIDQGFLVIFITLPKMNFNL